ncbi:MAG: hypothetical protein GXP29_03525 [Planctomycetes bacterium]|nr:hypothetical protein [Planctomycetota bacterium]
MEQKRSRDEWDANTNAGVPTNQPPAQAVNRFAAYGPYNPPTRVRVARRVVLGEGQVVTAKRIGDAETSPAD